MLHARIAARAFNTPLLVEPTKAMAFLSGLGARILGRQVELVEGDDAPGGAASLAARASILAGNLTERLQQHGDAPYPVVDGTAVIEIAGLLQVHGLIFSSHTVSLDVSRQRSRIWSRRPRKI